MTGEEIYSRYLAASAQVAGDEELTLKVLCKMFGGADGLWHLIHTHITDLDDAHRVVAPIGESHPLEEDIQNLEQALNDVISETIETEFLTDRINTIKAIETGFTLLLESGKEVDITFTDVKSKILLQNNQLAFDHFAGLMEESDVLSVFRLVDLYYVD